MCSGALCWRLGKRGKGFLVKPVLVGHGSGLGGEWCGGWILVLMGFLVLLVHWC